MGQTIDSVSIHLQGSCKGHARDMQETCKGQVKDRYGTCKGNSRDMGHAWKTIDSVSVHMQ